MALEDIAGYSLRRRLGSGSAGTVWLVRDRASGRNAVLKRVPITAISHPEELREHLSILQRIDHPHLARLQELRETGTEWLLISQYVVAGTLSALLGRRGPLTSGELVTLLTPLAEALDYLHRTGLTHGRVTPANIMFDADGRPVLTDAGLHAHHATAPSDDLTSLATVAHHAGGDPTVFTPGLFSTTHNLLTIATPTPINLAFTEDSTPPSAPNTPPRRKPTPTDDPIEHSRTPLPPPPPAPTTPAFLRPTPPKPPAPATPRSAKPARRKPFRPNRARPSPPQSNPLTRLTPRAPATDPAIPSTIGTRSHLPNDPDAGAAAAGTIPGIGAPRHHPDDSGAGVPAAHTTPTVGTRPHLSNDRGDASSPASDVWGGGFSRPSATRAGRRRSRRRSWPRASRRGWRRRNARWSRFMRPIHSAGTSQTPTSRTPSSDSAARTRGGRRYGFWHPAYGVLAAVGVGAVVVLVLGRLTVGALDSPAGTAAAADRARQSPSPIPPSQSPTIFPPPPTTPTQPPPTAREWTRTLQALDAQRAQAFWTLDLALLDTIYVPGTEPWAADRALLSTYRKHQIRVRGLQIRIDKTTIESQTPSTVVLRTVDHLTAGQAVDRTGTTTPLPSGTPSTRRITLTSTPSTPTRSPPTWRITAITSA
ncbi:protein kinase [Kribbella sp. NPDC023972]|uniref:protein kinase domain-containing protein n=1 Tax=Kribbella sp. NPDC023972 TaxID=3154795 RepID=UPI0033FCC9E4